MEALQRKALELRKDVLDMVVRAGAGHIGGDFSVMEILVTLYYKHLRVDPQDPRAAGRDRFILSKGHSVEAYYAVLADRGFFPKERLAEYARPGSDLIGHPTAKIPGIETNSGSLGHGLSVGAGMALAGKMDRAGYRVYVVMGDGELAEGSVWEAAMFAGHHRLDNLCAVVDRNRLQISGGTEDILRLEPLRERFSSFGWRVIPASGNDTSSLDAAFTKATVPVGAPCVILADTVKGCGVSFMENRAGWHHRVPSDEEYQQAAEELKRRIEAGG